MYAGRLEHEFGVDAALDQFAYSEGDNVTLSLTVENLRDVDVNLFARVKLDGYDAVRAFDLAGFDTRTFTMPAVLGDGKLLYAVYTNSGRSLYINSLYLHPRPPTSAGVTLHTDRQVYVIGDAVTVTVKSVPALV